MQRRAEEVHVRDAIVVGAGACGLHYAWLYANAYRPSLEVMRQDTTSKPLLLLDGSERPGGRLLTVDDLNYGAGIIRQGDVRLKQWICSLGLNLSEFHPSFFHSVSVANCGDNNIVTLLSVDVQHGGCYETRNGGNRVFLDNETQVSQWGLSVLKALRTLRRSDPPTMVDASTGKSESFGEWVRRVLASKQDADAFLSALVYGDTHADDVDTVLATYRFEEDNFVQPSNMSASIQGKWPALVEAALASIEPLTDFRWGCAVRSVEWSSFRNCFAVTMADNSVEYGRHVALCITPEQLAKLQRLPSVAVPRVREMLSSVLGWAFIRAYVTFENLDWLLAFERRHQTQRNLSEPLAEADSIATDSALGYIIPIDDKTLMIAYSDGERAKRWFNVDPFEWYVDTKDTNVRYASVWDRSAAALSAPPKWVAAVIGELQDKIVDRQTAVPPANAILSCSAVYWPAGIHVTRPGRGAWSSAPQGIRVARNVEFVSQPGYGVLGIANEAFSTSQGWTEGAVESAQVLFNRISIAHHQTT